MVIIFHDIYRRKYRIFVNFWFSCSNFDGQIKSLNSKIHFFPVVCGKNAEQY